jgi:hypothetical protein
VLGRVTGEEGRDVEGVVRAVVGRDRERDRRGVVRSVVGKDRERGRRDYNVYGIDPATAEGLKSRF